jgi:hypothetical protein
MGKPVVHKKDPKLHFIDPSTTYLDALSEIINDKVKVPKGLKKNEYVGELIYRTLGSTSTLTGGTAPTDRINRRRPEDVSYMVADPFDDPKVDQQRIENRGKLDYLDIQNRVTLFLASDGLYHVIHGSSSKNVRLTDDFIASFLLRVSFDKTEFQQLKSFVSKTKFSFKFDDRDNLRDPVITRDLGAATRKSKAS